MNLTNVGVNKVKEIFDLVQHSTACHLKHAVTLKQIFETTEDQEKNELFIILCNCLRHAFSTDHKEKVYIKRIINFMAIFATSFKLSTAENDEPLEFHPILVDIFKFALELSNSSNEFHRYWSCTLFNRIFQDLEELTDELYEDVKDSMLQRLRDPKAAIRCQAIIALHRLQDPYDDEDPIIADFCNILDSDFNAKVRQLCLEKMALNKRSLRSILTRIRDVDVNVRLTGLQKLQPIPKFLTVSEKRLVLQCGFLDASEKINQITNELVQTWLEKYDNDYLKLIKSIRLDACEEDISITTYLTEQMLNTLFRSTPLETIVQYISVNEEKKIEYSELNWETIIYCRIAIEFLRKSDGFEDHLNTVLPELVHFCRYIKEYFTFVKNNESFSELQHQFIIQQFFLITQGYDISDHASRQCLNSLVHYVIQNEDLSADTAEVVIQNLEKTIPNVFDRSMFVCEIISNVVHGEEFIDYVELEQKEQARNLMISQLQSDINELQQEENHLAFTEKNFIQAERVKLEIEAKKAELNNLRTKREYEQGEKKTDVQTMMKCLTIAEGFLRSCTITEFNPAIATLNSTVIQSAIMHEDAGVQAKALKCYGLCCVIDYRTARYGIHLFSGVLFANDSTDSQVLIISLNVIVDILTIYGLSLIENHDEKEASDSLEEDEKKVFVGGTSLTDIIQGLADHLDHEDLQVQRSATKGICILLLHNRVTSSSLLSRIIIKWANPATDDEKLKQFIGLTLNSLFKSTNCHTYCADAVITTIRTLAHAPQTSALYDINIDNIMKFMMTWCQMSSQGNKIHIDLAYKMCNLMCDKPRAKANFAFSKALCLLTIPESDTIDELLALCDDLRDVIRDTSTIKYISKFNTNLSQHKTQLQPIPEEQMN